ncbi:MAG: CBS domain-containing protein, partial [Bacteroidales bacterium]
MKESGQTLLPVVDQTTNRFIGMVSRESAEKHENSIDSVLAIREAQYFVSIQNQNIFDAARLMDKHKLTLLPVLDSERHYMGVVDRSTLNERIVQVMNFTEYGSIITIHFEERD